jgi:hypothetical protein
MANLKLTPNPTVNSLPESSLSLHSVPSIQVPQTASNSQHPQHSEPEKPLSLHSQPPVQVQGRPNGSHPYSDFRDYRDVQFGLGLTEERDPSTLRGPGSEMAQRSEPHMMAAKVVD